MSPNNDTLYVIAPLDMSGGPLLLHTPDTGDRYYVLQFVDAWSNNFAYVGRRSSGTAAADWLLVPAGYTGDIPAGATPIEVPSDLAVIVGRVQVDGETDLPAVHAIQDQFTLAPVEGNSSARRSASTRARGVRRPQVLGTVPCLLAGVPASSGRRRHPRSRRERRTA